MIRFRVSKLGLGVVIASVAVLAVVAAGHDKILAQFVVPNVPAVCGIQPTGATTPANPTPYGNGYVYRTYVIGARANPNAKGGEVSQSCTVPTTLSVGGQNLPAQQVELGRRLDSHVGGRLAPTGFEVETAPEPGFGSQTASGEDTYFQDDGSAIIMNQQVLHCAGIPSLCWSDSYARGISAGDFRVPGSNIWINTNPANAPIQGAGFFTHAQRTIYPDGPGNLPNITAGFIIRNTYGGNYEAKVLVTIKYRQIPPLQFDLVPSTPVITRTGPNATVAFRVENQGDGASRLADGTGVDVSRRVWLNGEPVFSNSPRVIINPGSGNAYAPPVYSLTDLEVGDVICAGISVKPARGTTGVTTFALTPEENRGTTDPTNDANCVVNTAKPYFKVYGGNVVVGSKFESECDSGLSGSAGIRASSSTGSDGRWRGASTQFAAHAVGRIEGFYTAGLRDGAASPAQAPMGLTFGNKLGNSAVAMGAGGQDSSGAVRCLPDYFALSESIEGRTQVTSPSSFSPTDVSRRAYYYEGDVTITGSGIVLDNTTQLTGPNQIPYFYLIVRGNINIAPSVSRLDGVYIAQGGQINTCAAADIVTQCRNKLTVNGAFIANKVLFNRTLGDVASAPANETDSNNIAEVFNFIPSLYLARLPNENPPTTNIREYDSIIGLPPIL